MKTRSLNVWHLLLHMKNLPMGTQQDFQIIELEKKSKFQSFYHWIVNHQLLSIFNLLLSKMLNHCLPPSQFLDLIQLKYSIFIYFIFDQFFHYNSFQDRLLFPFCIVFLSSWKFACLWKMRTTARMWIERTAAHKPKKQSHKQLAVAEIIVF